MEAQELYLLEEIYSRNESDELGIVVISAHEIGLNDTIVKMRVYGSKLDKKDLFGKSDPYLVFHRSDPNGGTFSPVHKTEVLKNTLDPVWQEFGIPRGTLCDNNYDQKIFIQCWDWDKDGSSDLIGNVTTTLKEMIATRDFPLIEPKTKASKGSKYTNSGVLHVQSIQEVKKLSFLDYLRGCEVSLIVGVDYTASNGDPNDPNSLHYRNPNGAPTEYMQAIRCIGDILAYYDRDQMFPAFGFGGQYQGETHHCFPINGNEQQPECPYINGVLGAYAASFQWVKLYGPTNFSPIIKRATNYAKQVKNGEKYFVLLIITDGEITDENHTIEAIREAAKYPLSIIIIGVGKADFTNMKILDDDEGKLGFSRDIVQFVPLRDYVGRSLDLLARDVLAEFPGQLVSYMVKNNVVPKF